MLITPDSCISSQRSLPSRVRSPTPANTEKPPCLQRDVVDELHDDDGLAHARAAEQADLAALQERLDQVDDLHAGLEHLLEVDCSSNAGAWRWMGMRFLALTGPSLSTGSPITLSTRPSVARPTGTVMGPPRSIAFMPRTMPSVGSMATQRTRPSPRCCSTSRMTLSGVGNVEAFAGDAQRRVNRRQRRFGELHVHRGTRDLNDVSDIFCHMNSVSVAQLISRQLSAVSEFTSTDDLFVTDHVGQLS